MLFVFLLFGLLVFRGIVVSFLDGVFVRLMRWFGCTARCGGGFGPAFRVGWWVLVWSDLLTGCVSVCWLDDVGLGFVCWLG